jgi:hypothetical protein
MEGFDRSDPEDESVGARGGTGTRFTGDRVPEGVEDDVDKLRATPTAARLVSMIGLRVGSCCIC